DDLVTGVQTCALPIYALCPPFVIIYFATKLFREKEGIKHALITAIVGAIVYSVVYFLLGSGFWAALAAGVIWLLVLRAMYRIGRSEERRVGNECRDEW